jgi:hypothetical protein
VICVWLKRLALASSLTLAACSMTPSTETVKPLPKLDLTAGGLQPGESSLPFCLAADPITYSARRDTPETVEQIRGHNAVGSKLGCSKWNLTRQSVSSKSK